MAMWSIVNVVATANLQQNVDFELIRQYPEIFHDSDVYSGRVAYFKEKRMEGKVSIFHSGKMISVGTKTEEEAHKELQMAANYLAEKGALKKVDIDSKIQNIVVVGNAHCLINLEKFSELEPKIIYEPEQFAGAIIRFQEPFKASILLFASGKFVITGLKIFREIEPTIKNLTEIIEKYQ